MKDWVALLRGVNVNGVTVRSVELAALLRGLGLSEVRTVLASGNACFRSAEPIEARSELKARIERALSERFGYDAWILLVSRAELAAVVAAYPFDDTDAGRQPYVVFCVDEATQRDLVAAAADLDASVDPVLPGGGVVYWNPPTGQSTQTPFAKTLARGTYRPRTTARNLRTLRTILA